MRTSQLLLFVFCLYSIFLWSQEEKPKHWGIQFGYGSQQIFPFQSKDYTLKQGHVLGQYYIKEFQLSNLRFDLLWEGGYYLSEHQLLNKWFTTTELFKDFPDDFQSKMIKRKKIHQGVTHLACEINYFIGGNTQLYLYAGIGPMWTSQQTERLAAGFAFSDNIGIGLKVKINPKMWINQTIVLRHESNANLKFPNSGHNTVSARLGIVFNLNERQKVGVQPKEHPLLSLKEDAHPAGKDLSVMKQP